MGRLLLLWLGLALVGCPTNRDRGGGDDDDASDDDDATGDDDDATGDDDDASPTEQAPVIEVITVCQSTTFLGSFGLFEVEVTDDQENLLDPVTYRVQIDGGSNPSFTWEEELGGHGWIDHTQDIGTSPLNRGTTHTWTFTVLDSTGNLSDPIDVEWLIPEDEQGDPCGA